MLHGDFFFLAGIFTGNVPENTSVDSDVATKLETKKTEKKTGNIIANHSEKKKIEAKPIISFNEQVNKEFPCKGH